MPERLVTANNQQCMCVDESESYEIQLLEPLNSNNIKYSTSQLTHKPSSTAVDKPLRELETKAAETASDEEDVVRVAQRSAHGAHLDRRRQTCAQRLFVAHLDEHLADVFAGRHEAAIEET